MPLSKEQKRKIKERLKWLEEDVFFLDLVRGTSDVRSNVTILGIVKVALERLELEKLSVTGKGRYQDDCEQLVHNADAFFKNYDHEVKQIGLSMFRFVHHVLEDHLGEEEGTRAFALNRERLMLVLTNVLDNVRLLVIDNKKE